MATRGTKKHGQFTEVVIMDRVGCKNSRYFDKHKILCPFEYLIVILIIKKITRDQKN